MTTPPLQRNEATRPEPLDVAGLHEDIRRLTCGHPLFKVAFARGHDPEDLIQSVFAGLLRRQRGRGRYDPQRANDPRRAFSKYIHMVAGSVLANVLDKARRLGAHEQVGVTVRKLSDDRSSFGCDAASYACEGKVGAEDELDLGALIETVLLEVRAGDEDVARDLMSGVSRAQIATRYGWTRAEIDEVAEDLRATLEERR